MSDTPERGLFGTAAVTSFRMNGQFPTIAEELADPAGLAAAAPAAMSAANGTQEQA
ncbi:hypothetical protein ACQP1G_03225 [Nocardia sp. CA-107356]|uniref:hypothetical protein n=1 Tax=Nocardia sp. CA-107356 TaxID=3239972 RepID=UPI003D8FCD66